MKFHTPEQALKWAYNTVNKPLEGEFDNTARAYSLLSLCERTLPTLHMAYVSAQFGRKSYCGDLLAHHIAAGFGVGLHSKRSIELIIRAYCGEKIGLREMRKSIQCGMLKAVSLRNRAYDSLDAIHAQAMDRLRMEMESKGWFFINEMESHTI